MACSSTSRISPCACATPTDDHSGEPQRLPVSPFRAAAVILRARPASEKPRDRPPSPDLTPLDRIWLTEAVRLREEHAGPLDDDEANRQARTQGGDLPALIERRALWLAHRDGLIEALRHWRQGARLGALALILLALFTGAGLAFAALGDGQRPVNVFWALGSLLGLNLLTLLGWLLGLLLTGDSSGALGRLWLWLSESSPAMPAPRSWPQPC